MDGSSPFTSGNLLGTLINTLAREILAPSHTNSTAMYRSLFRKLGGNCLAGRWLVAGRREIFA